MRVLRGTLTFVLGMIIGIILFVIAIGGAVAVIGTSITVGELQGSFTDQDIISSDSQLYNQTILEAIQSIMSDVQAVDSLTMRTLYEHYGIELLNGVSGIDFTNKDFYDTGLSTLLNDLSIVTNSFTLNDISGLVGVDFDEYGLPVLSDNLDNNLQTALDNILSSLNGDLSIRDIDTNFGIDIGIEDNALIKALQDVSFSNFGAVVNALELNTLIDADCDLFILQGNNRVYQKTDEYVLVSASELKNGTPTIGVETYYAGATEKADGTWTMNEKELRYVKKTNAEGVETYVVDNSCYSDDYDSNKEFYRHVLYEQATLSSSVSDLAVLTYFNRIASINGTSFELKQADFVAITDLKNVDFTSLTPNADGTITFNATPDVDLYYMLDDSITKDSLLCTLSDGETAKGNAYIRVHEGTSETILQIVAPMTVSELQNADDFLGSLKVGDVVDTSDPDTANVIIALKDCKLTEIGSEINKLKIDELIDIDDDSEPMLKALKNHGCTLDNIGDEIDKFTIGELLEINYDEYLPCNDSSCSHTGHYVQETITIPYNKYIHNESDKYEDSTGTWVVDVVKYRLERDTDLASTQRYYLSAEGSTALAVQMMAKRGYTLDSIGSEINNMGFDELVRITPDSALIMKSLAKHDANLDNIGTTIDKLLIDEVIEINDESSIIMKSLKNRGFKINELGNVTKDLTLKEVTDITCDNYVEDNTNGKYVHIVTATDDYYTLYNPAIHAGYARYTREEAKGSSSKVLQRLANSTVDGLSTAFDSLTLGDVLDIDIDILAQDTSTEAGKSYFYYDVANSLYMRQDNTYTGTDGNYYVVAEGESSSVLKRLAYVQIDKLSDAMEIVMKDMMLSELVDIYTESAVIENSSSAITADDMYIVAPFDYDKDELGNPTKPYTFVLNSDSGRYIQRPYYFKELSAPTKTGTTYYKWKQIENATEFGTAIVTKDIYYYNAAENEYVYNTSLSAYVGGKELAKLDPSERDFSKLYTRVLCTESESGAIGVDIYSGADLYVLLNGEYTSYNSDNVLHLGLPIYQKVDGTCYVETTTPGVDGDTSYKYLGTDSTTHKSLENIYSKVYCEDIYMQNDTGYYAYIGNEYVPYANSMGDVTRYNKIVGYLASANECYTSSDSGSTYDSVSPLGNGNITHVTVERQKSERVLQTLADATIGGINDKIKTAKIGDLMEIEPGSIFEDFADKELTSLNSELQKALKTWTIGKLAQKANITSIDPLVKSALEGVTLDNFFKSLTYSSSAGIVVDLEKAYGYNS